MFCRMDCAAIKVSSLPMTSSGVSPVACSRGLYPSPCFTHCASAAHFLQTIGLHSSSSHGNPSGRHFRTTQKPILPMCAIDSVSAAEQIAAPATAGGASAFGITGTSKRQRHQRHLSLSLLFSIPQFLQVCIFLFALHGFLPRQWGELTVRQRGAALF